MKLRAPQGRVLVEVEKVESVTSGGIFIPVTWLDRRQNMMTIGKVVAVGPHVMCAFKCKDGEIPDDEADNTRQVRPGDRIWFAKYGGASFEVAEKENRGIDLRVINDEDIQAILDDEEENEEDGGEE